MDTEPAAKRRGRPVKAIETTEARGPVTYSLDDPAVADSVCRFLLAVRRLREKCEKERSEAA